jgi:hypothetical protein
MQRVLLAALAGAVLYFLWGFIFWVVLPIGPMVFQQAADEPALAEQIRRSIQQPGTYLVPGMELMTTDAAEFTRRHEAGPVATLFVHSAGRPVMGATVLLGGFATMFASTLLMSVLLKVTAIPCYAGRVIVVCLAGLAGIFLGDLGFPFWYDWPWHLWLASAVFHVSGWLLVGLVLAAIVRPRPQSVEQESVPAGATQGPKPTTARHDRE